MVAGAYPGFSEGEVFNEGKRFGNTMACFLYTNMKINCILPCFLGLWSVKIEL